MRQRNSQDKRAELSLALSADTRPTRHLNVAHVETAKVRNDLADLPAVYAALEAFAAATDLPDSVRRTLLLIVEELFSNTVSYGYPDGSEDEIGVSVRLGPGHVELMLVDRAIPFDSGALSEDPNVEGTVEERDIGGLGLFLVHQLAEKVSHERDGDTNRTVILIALDRDGEAD